MSEAPEIPHPRQVFDLLGAEEAERAFLDALDRGRLHHAWLLVGPEGVGKATFAYRAARRLLGAAADPSRGPLGAAPDDPVSRLVASQSHPDLLVLERAGEDGKLKKSISVEQARQAPEFFAKSPSTAAYRVAIVDTADDLNSNAANALLKTLEEPPQRGVLFLVSHAPGKLLATLRSRCRRLPFRAWSEEAAADFVRSRAALTGADARQAAHMAKGSPGQAWRLAAGEGIELDALAARLVAGQLEGGELLRLTDRFRGGEGMARFSLFFARLAEHVRAGVEAGHTGATERAVERWERLVALPEEVDGLNLDRADAFWSAVADLRGAQAA